MASRTLKRWVVTALVLALPALAAASAVAHRSQTPSAAAAAHLTPFPQLNRWMSIFAMRQVTVQCLDENAWNSDEIEERGWAYVPLAPPMNPSPNHAVAAPLVCAGALAIAEHRRTAHPWQMALGALALVHEAYHLRIWRHRLDEGRVNCQAIRHFEVGVRLLGGSRQLADELLPYALSIYWRLAVETPAYHWSGCRVPNWWH